jgi:hypothetical protein
VNNIKIKIYSVNIGDNLTLLGVQAPCILKIRNCGSWTNRGFFYWDGWSEPMSKPIYSGLDYFFSDSILEIERVWDK